jgi:hypothetical protein
MLAAAPAMAYNVSAVYKDCEANGELTGHYSRAELQAALNQIPSQMAEYSDCQDIIKGALLAASKPTGHHNNSAGVTAGGGKNGGGGSGEGGFSHGKAGTGRTGSQKGKPSRSSSGNADTLASAPNHPSSIGTGSSRSLPAALVVVLIVLALAAVSGGAVAIRRRVVARHGT